jgi:hypothetical protein
MCTTSPSRAPARLKQPVDPQVAQAPHDLGQRLVVGEVLEAHGPAHGPPVDRPAVHDVRSIGRSRRAAGGAPRRRAPRAAASSSRTCVDQFAQAVHQRVDALRRSPRRSSRRRPSRGPRRRPSIPRAPSRPLEQVAPGSRPARRAARRSWSLGRLDGAAIADRSSSTQSTRARSTWRRKSWPSPRPCAAPSMSPGTSAMTNSVASPGRADAPAHPHDAEVRHERREGIVGDLRPRRRDPGDQRRLADVGEADQRHVGLGASAPGRTSSPDRPRPARRRPGPGGRWRGIGRCRRRRGRPAPRATGRRAPRGRRAARRRARRRPCPPAR